MRQKFLIEKKCCRPCFVWQYYILYKCMCARHLHTARSSLFVYWMHNKSNANKIWNKKCFSQKKKCHIIFEQTSYKLNERENTFENRASDARSSVPYSHHTYVFIWNSVSVQVVKILKMHIELVNRENKHEPSVWKVAPCQFSAHV